MEDAADVAEVSPGPGNSVTEPFSGRLLRAYRSVLFDVNMLKVVFALLCVPKV